MPNHIRKAMVTDVETIVSLSEQKRIQYQEYQPLFWRKAADSVEKQKPFLEKQINQDYILALVHEERGEINGFVIGNIGGGERCDIDDFAVANHEQWESIGKALLQEIGRLAKGRGIPTIEVVCGHLDQAKRTMLQSAGLSIKRYWFTSAIEPMTKTSSQSHEHIQVRTAIPEDATALANFLKRDDGQVSELENDRMSVLAAFMDGEVHGCLVAMVVPTPPVYDPGGTTCLVTTFAIRESEKQVAVSHSLLATIGELAQKDGAVQYVVMCDSNNQHMQSALTEFGMTIASEWYQGEI